MFCPEGYTVFDRVDAILTRWASRIFELDRTEYDALKFDEFYGPRAEWMRTRNNLLMLRRTYVRDCPTTSIASPDGRLLRIASSVMMHAQEPTVDYRGYEDFGSHMFLSEETWTIETGRTQERTEAASSLFAKRFPNGYPDEPFPEVTGDYLRSEWPDFIELSKAVEAKRFIPVFQNFDGWALCVKDSEMPEDIEERSGLVLPHGQKLTRSSLAQDPDTNGELSVSAITQAILAEAELGVPVVRDEARRRWANGLKREVWKEAWREVTRLRPELARPGPKRAGSAR